MAAPRRRAMARLSRWLSVGVTSAVLLAVVGCASAEAAVRHEYLSQITEIPVGSGAPLTGPLSEPRGVAVDSGQLYVAENISGGGGQRLDVFNASSDAFVSQFAQTPQLNPEFGVALGHSTGETVAYVGGGESGENGFVGRVAVFGPAGALLGSWDGADTPSGSFGEGAVGPIAADNSAASPGDWAAGDVYVGGKDPTVVDVFKPEPGGKEKYVTQLTGPEPGVSFNDVSALAVNQANGDVLVGNENVVDVFEPTVLGEYALVATLTGPPGRPIATRVDAIAVDGANGDIYVAEETGREGIEGVIYQFSSTGTYLGRLAGQGSPLGGFAGVKGVAVDPATGHVFVSETDQERGVVDVYGPNVVIPDVATSSVSKLAPTSVTLAGTVNPDDAGSATCEFELGTSTAYGQRVPCGATVPNGNSPVDVQAPVTGLTPDTTYHYRLDATDTDGTNNGEGFPEDQGEFTTSGPGMHGESVSDVTANTVAFQARINPHDAPTTYYFQYGTGSGYEVAVPAPPGAFLGSGEGDVEVNRHLVGLTADTAYHYRVVAVSELAPGQFEAFAGPDRTFTTQMAENVPALPDGREWEMVSPPDKHGALIWPLTEGTLTQAAADGDAFAYLANAPTEAQVKGDYANYVPILSSRTPGGWQSSDVALPHSVATGAPVGFGTDYRFFSSDLTTAVVEPKGAFTQLSPEASERTVYLRDNATCQASPESCYRPLVTNTPGYADVPAGTRIEGETGFTGQVRFVGASADASHVVLFSNVGLTATAGDNGGLYEWSGGKLRLISALPAGEGGQPLPLAQSPSFGGRGPSPGAGDPRGAISEDGSRVFWTGENFPALHLYMRDFAAGEGETVRLDTVQAGASGKGPEQAEFQIASKDGSRVFFTDTQDLTANSATRSVGQPALYECEMTEGAGKPACELTDLTPSPSGEQPDVMGVLGASVDGSYVYFVAGGVLGNGAEHGAESHGHNLYLAHFDAASKTWSTEFIAALSAEDFPDWEVRDIEEMPARVSPDGLWLAFMSQQQLTGYDNADAVTGAPDEEVFLYDAAAGPSGRLVCASCNPTGARPTGVESGPFTGRLIDTHGWPSNSWLAANIPGWTSYALQFSVDQSRYLSDGGRLFFNSSDALVPQDVDGTEDVYEYEPAGYRNGEGKLECSQASSGYSPRSEGCVGLISSGTSAEESAFLDASESGADVFFLTSAQLVAQDVDTLRDVYDAHECTGESPCAPQPALVPPPCTTGDACKPAPSPQPSVFGQPASETFSGAGNTALGSSTPKSSARRLTRAQQLARALKACRRTTDRRRVACERHARRRYRVVKARKAKSKRKGMG